MTISKLMKNEPTLQNLSDFDNKSLLIVDDDAFGVGILLLRL